LKKFGGGLVAPSANKFGRLSPTSAADVRAEFGDELALVLDGGSCKVGIESTIIDLTTAQPRILRPGMIGVSQVYAILGEKLEAAERASGMSIASASDTAISKKKLNDVESDEEHDIRVPGSLASHYAPVTPLYLIPSSDFSNFVDSQLKADRNITVVSFRSRPDQFSDRTWITLPKIPADFARLIYSTLRRLDALDPRMIILESPPVSDSLSTSPDDDWSAINDRLGRAAFRH
jgi:L-threonylcarbamoyladenylate synthase